MKNVLAGAACLALLPASAIAQIATNCIVTGYGQQQHLWCNSTSPPPADPGYSQGASNFGAALGYAIQQAAARRQAQADVTAQWDAIQAQVQAFAADPRYPRFQELRGYMGEIMGAGRARTLPDAYAIAAAEHPVK